MSTQKIDKDQIIKLATEHYGKFMDVILPGWQTDANMTDTPRRVSKAFVNELFSGLYDAELKITAFDNIDKYDGIVLQSNIPVKSVCSHHHQIITGVAHVAYIPSPTGKIIGLSKLNRIVEYYSRRPQVQENLTTQIHAKVNEVCSMNSGVAVLIKAGHACCSHRGVNHNSVMQTSKLSGAFLSEDRVREELYNLINYATIKE